MTWLTKLRLYLGYEEESSEPPTHDTLAEAARRLEAAKAGLTEANQRKAEVHEVVSSLATLRDRNHFGESIERAMMRKERLT